VVADPIELEISCGIRIDSNPAEARMSARSYRDLDSFRSGGRGIARCGGQQQNRGSSEPPRRRGVDHSKLASNASMSD
jgi:hypothetical protein